MPDEIKDILNAIDKEFEVARQPRKFLVVSCKPKDGLWRVVTKYLGRRSIIDGALDDAFAQWSNSKEPGWAKVLTYSSDSMVLTLQYLSGYPPLEASEIFVYPPDFLTDLRNLWEREDIAKRALQMPASMCHEVVARDIYFESSFPTLRTAQKRAFALLKYKGSFLWGPPGTGKTYTIGSILAGLIATHPQERMLLLAPTNTALDEAILGVDEAMRKLGEIDPRALKTKGMYLRMGVWFDANRFADKAHILPVIDESSIDELREHEQSKPHKDDSISYQRWKFKDSRLRQSISRSYRNISLLALTTHEATSKFDDLRQLGIFDLIIFDEASQISRARALPLMTLGNSSIFAGDHKQLSPVVLSRKELGVDEWLGKSMFIYMKEKASNVCMLDEQDRMAKPICNLVSRSFYESKLQVAESALHDKNWLAKRMPVKVPWIPAPRNIFFEPILKEATFDKKYNGMVRYESVAKIKAWVDKLLKDRGLEFKEIVVLSPRHSQNKLLRQELISYGVRVSTVHAIQGNQYRVVIFDPISGEHVLNHGDEDDRLINVAISRAQSILIIPFTKNDLVSNATLRRLYEIDLGTKVGNTKIPLNLATAAKSPLFPDQMMNRLVSWSVDGEAKTWRIIKSEKDDRYITIQNIHRPNEKKSLLIDFLKKQR